MTTPPRIPGKTGPAARHDTSRPLRAEVHPPVRQRAAPAPVYPVDVSGGITDWGMLGNAEYGDCTFAGRQHNRMAKAAAAKLTEPWETAAELVAEYLAYDHGPGRRGVIADLLLAVVPRRARSSPSRPVDHTNPAQMDPAMQVFHGATSASA